MQFGGNAQQLGPIIPIALGVQVEDPEGITFDGKFYYVIGSQSKSRSSTRTGLVRFRFDPTTKRVHSVAGIAGLREFLLKNVTGLPAQALTDGQRDGLNIEGIAWDPSQQSLLAGLRSPLLNREAILIRLQFRDPEGPFSLENFTVAPLILVPLGGAGIRDLGYDPQTEKLLIISGATQTHGNKPPFLWSWKNGVLERLAQLNASAKPEGIVRLNRESLLIVCDESAYFILNDPMGQ
jgi:uncharacterized protein YjiK